MLFDTIAFRVMGTRDYCKLFLWVPKLLLQAIYFWPQQKYNVLKRNSMFIIMMVLVTFLNFGVNFHFRVINNDLMKCALQVTFWGPPMQASVKLLVLYFNSNEIKQLQDYVLYKFWPYDLLKSKLKDELKQFYYVIVMIMISLITLGTIYSAMINGTNWAHHTFPFEVSYPFIDCNSTPFYQIIYGFQFITIQYFMYCMILGCDHSFLAICSSVISQYKILQHALLVFDTEEMYEVNSKLRSIGTDELAGKNYSVHKEFFVRCINHHQLLLEITKAMNRMFSPIEMAQLTCCLTGVCVGVFTLTYVENPSFSIVFTLLFFTATSLNELFIYCAVGNELHYQASFLPEYIFRSNWSKYEDNVMTKDFMFMLQRAQDIPQLSAYNLYDINMDSYIKVIKLSFSVYTLLSKMKEKKPSA